MRYWVLSLWMVMVACKHDAPVCEEVPACPRVECPQVYCPNPTRIIEVYQDHLESCQRENAKLRDESIREADSYRQSYYDELNKNPDEN